MPPEFLDTLNYTWKIEGIHGLINRAIADKKVYVESDAFSPLLHPTVKFALRFYPAIDKQNAEIRVMIKEIGIDRKFFVRSDIKLIGFGTSGIQKSSITFIERNSKGRTINFNEFDQSKFRNFDETTLEIQLNMHFKEPDYFEWNPELTAQMLSNAYRGTFTQSETFTSPFNPAIRFAFRFYPNYNLNSAAHTKVSIYFFDSSVEPSFCIHYRLGANVEEFGTFYDVKPGEIILKEYGSKMSIGFYEMKFYLTFVDTCGHFIQNDVQDSLVNSKSMFPNFSQMREQYKCLDCIVTIGEEKIEAHKLVLVMNSKFFEREFAIKNTVVVENLDFDIVRSIIDFCYSGNLEDLHGTDAYLLYAACVLRMTELKKYFEHKLCRSTTEENVKEHLKLAKKCNAIQLKRKCLKLLLDDSEKVPDLTIDELAEVLVKD